MYFGNVKLAILSKCIVAVWRPLLWTVVIQRTRGRNAKSVACVQVVKCTCKCESKQRKVCPFFANKVSTNSFHLLERSGVKCFYLLFSLSSPWTAMHSCLIFVKF